MIENKTVFVLGAGASCPYGYPSGIKLREDIISNFCDQYQHYMDADPNLKQDITMESNKAKGFTDKFKKSSTKSIDLFLARNTEFKDVGKKAIAFRILDAEYHSKFRESMKDRSLDWYSYIFDRLTDGLVKKDDYSRFCENNVSFITFNYDRSLEHFLYESLIHSFNNTPSKKIKEQISQLGIIHVFGQVSGLDWQELPSKLEYRHEVNRIKIQKLVKNLRIIYEEEKNPELEEARELIGEAQRIFFLGFGYAKENLELLKISERLNAHQYICGTAFGSTTKEIQDIKTILELDTQIEPWDCLMLLRQCW